MDIGIAEVRKSKKNIEGDESTIAGAEIWIGGPRATPKVYKLTPMSGLMVSHGLMFSDGLKVAIHCDRIPSGIGHAPIGLCVKFRTDRKRSAQWTAAVTVSGDLMVSYDV